MQSINIESKDFSGQVNVLMDYKTCIWEWNGSFKIWTRNIKCVLMIDRNLKETFYHLVEKELVLVVLMFIGLINVCHF